ncbi:MAG: maleylacetoacetate isomerase [Burkholderiales bacterium]
MQLYGFFRSSTSFRLRIALAYKGVPWESRPVSLPKMEHRSADFLAKNPQGLVPALVDDAGRVFTQSMAMIEYLDDIHPEPPLMPKGAEEKWYVRAVSQIIGCEMHPLNNVRVLKYLKGWGHDDAKVNGEWYAHWIAEGFASLEQFLAAQKRHGRFCLGDHFTMADVCLVPQVFNARRYDCDLAPYPTVMKLFEAGAALDAVKQVEPSTQPDAF